MLLAVAQQQQQGRASGWLLPAWAELPARVCQQWRLGLLLLR